MGLIYSIKTLSGGNCCDPERAMVKHSKCSPQHPRLRASESTFIFHIRFLGVVLHLSQYFFYLSGQTIVIAVILGYPWWIFRVLYPTPFASVHIIFIFSYSFTKRCFTHIPLFFFFCSDQRLVIDILGNRW